MNYRIRVIAYSSVTPSTTSTLAGSSCGTYADGTGTNAVLGYVGGPVYSDNGGTPVIFFTAGNRISAVLDGTGVTSTVAGGTVSGTADGDGTAAEFNSPTGVCIIVGGRLDVLYVADYGNKLIRVISPASVGPYPVSGPYTVSTAAGGGSGTPSGPAVDGYGTSATFGAPAACVEGPSGYVFVADSGFHTIRQIDISPRSPPYLVTTIAGTTGTSGYADGTAALFAIPFSLSYYQTDDAL